MSRRNDPHRDVIELLPWFVNGTLSAEEHAAVERHVNACLPCRKALNEERALAAVVGGTALSPLSPERGLDRLMSEVDAAARHGPGQTAVRPIRPRRQAWPIALAAGLAVGAVSLWVVLVDEQPSQADGAFSTLTASPSTRATRIDVVFSDGIAADDRGAVVREVDGRIVAGPSGIGRYTIEIRGGDASSEAMDRALDALRNDERVRLATPWLGDGEAR